MSWSFMLGNQNRLLRSVMKNQHNSILHTVNFEILARVLYSRNFAYAKFREKKILAKSLPSFTDIGKSCLSLKFSRHKYVF